MKQIIAFSLIVLLSLPIAALFTLMLSGFWRWFETVSGIESIGHSGPATWCYGLTFTIVLCSVLGVQRLFRHKNH